MNFASLQFAWFFPLVFVIYWGLRRLEWQNWFLLGISYYFYACWDVRFLLLIWFLTLVSYWAGLRIAASADDAFRNLYLKIYLAISLGVLAVFKYFNFFSDSLHRLLSTAGLDLPAAHLSIVLPAAISFFTFESLSYVIEIHQRHLPGTTRLRHYALFIAFFPKLVAGPIERPKVLLPQIENDRHLTWELMGRGAFLVLLGLVKKVAIADGLAPVVDAVYSSPSAASASDILLATLAFTFQIYCDFSGYSDITRGISKMLGIELSQNFRFPYFSKNPSDFWQRWHISLSSWLRDYVYIPLGGNRLGEQRTQLNLMLTMGLGGLWHGAAWNYVAWGLYQGALLVLYRWAGTLRPAASASVAPRAASPVLRWALMFVLVMYSWLLFRAHSLAQILDFTQTLLSGPYSAPQLKPPPLSTWVGLLLLAGHDAWAYRTGRAAFYARWSPLWLGCGCAALLLVMAMGLSNARSAFIYFQF